MVEAIYKADLDILLVERENSEDFSRNLELGGFILDLDSEDNFLGLEIVDASNKIALNQDELSNIEDVEVNLEKDEELMRIEIILWINDKKNVISSQYPSSAIA